MNNNKQRGSNASKMYGLWHISDDKTETDGVNGEYLFNKIAARIWANQQLKHLKFYKIYAVAASILLFFSISSLTYLMFNDNIFQTTNFVVKNGLRSISEYTLPDGTVVKLGSGSELQYPDNFNGDCRSVRLKGQAFFDVAKDLEKPFVVQTNTMDVVALGTAFEVFDFQEINRSEVILLNGKVRVDINNNAGEESFLLLPDEMLLIDKSTGIIVKDCIEASKYTVWEKQKRLSFENEKLSMIIPRLEQWYGETIVCDKELAEKTRFTFKVREESLDQLFFMFSKLSTLNVLKSPDGTYQIYNTIK